MQLPSITPSNELFSILDEKAFQEILRKWLEAYAQNKTSDNPSWLENNLLEAIPDLGKEDAKFFIDNVREHIEQIQSSIADIEEAKQKGMGREEWLYRNLLKVTEELKLDTQTAGTILGEWNTNLINKFIEAMPKESKEVIENLLSVTSPEEWNLETIKNNISLGEKIYNSISSINLEKATDKLIVSALPIPPFADISKIQEALEKNDPDFTSDIACAFKEAVDKKVIDIPAHIRERLPFPTKLPFEIPIYSSMSTMAVTAVSVANQVMSGKIDADEAVDCLMDASVATGEAATRLAFLKGGETAGTYVGTLISSVLPFSAPAVIPVCGVIGGFLGEKVAEPICGTLKKIGKVAKQVGHAVVDTVKSIVRNISEGIRSIGSSIASFFSW